MKKFARLMVLALVVAALAAIFAIPSSAQTGPVIYIADAGTGDGKTPDAPLGTAADYDYSKKGDANSFRLFRLSISSSLQAVRSLSLVPLQLILTTHIPQKHRRLPLSSAFLQIQAFLQMTPTIT